nr:MAG TPA: hypothetical protein [Caudoviricetes sp.]
MMRLPAETSSMGVGLAGWWGCIISGFLFRGRRRPSDGLAVAALGGCLGGLLEGVVEAVERV